MLCLSGSAYPTQRHIDRANPLLVRVRAPRSPDTGLAGTANWSTRPFPRLWTGHLVHLPAAPARGTNPDKPDGYAAHTANVRACPRCPARAGGVELLTRAQAADGLRSRSGDGSELTEHAEIVTHRPVLTDLAVDDAIDVHVGDGVGLAVAREGEPEYT
jgi:hypothetical protein